MWPSSASDWQASQCSRCRCSLRQLPSRSVCLSTLLLLGQTALSTNITFQVATGESRSAQLQHHGRALQQYGDWLTAHFVRPCNVNLVCLSRLGNQLLSMFLALHTARTLRSNLHITTHFKEGEGIAGHAEGGDSCYAGLLEKDPLDIPFGVTEGDCNGDLKVDGWVGRPALEPHDQDIRNNFAYMYSVMDWPAKRPAADELVIYLRAGDIFLQRSPDYYLWAPCSLYDKIIADGRFHAHKVSVVTDINAKNGEENPCTEYLVQKYAGLKLVSGDVGSDFSYLVHATHLVLGGVSTFGQLAAFLSPVLQHLYIFSHSEASTNNRNVEVGWPSNGYLDWPGVTPHHYHVNNYTSILREAVDMMLTFPVENIVNYNGAEFWHENVQRGVNNKDPWVPFSFTLLTSCEKTKEETVNKLRDLTLPWAVSEGQYIQRSVPTCVFAPEGWQDLLQQLDHPMNYYRAVYTPSGQHPPNDHLADGDLNACSSKLLLVYALQVMSSNPFHTTHFLWLDHESHLKSVAEHMKQIVTHDQQRPFFFSRRTRDGEDKKEMMAAILPASMFRPPLLKHEWVVRAKHGMGFREWLTHESMAEHTVVPLHS